VPHKVHTPKITKNPVAIRNLTARALYWKQFITKAPCRTIDSTPKSQRDRAQTLGPRISPAMFGRLVSSFIVAIIVIADFFFHFAHLLSRRLTDAVRDSFLRVADEARQDRSKFHIQITLTPKNTTFCGRLCGERFDPLQWLAQVTRGFPKCFSSQGGAMLTSTMRDNSQPPAIGNKQHWWGASLARCHRYFYSSMAV